MNYTEDYLGLKKVFHSLQNNKVYNSIEIIESSFESGAHQILPGTDQYYCKTHDQYLKSDFSFYTDVGRIKDHVHQKDIEIKENLKTIYHLIRPKSAADPKKVVFLFHGFNEKDWAKYLSWAKSICEGTGSTVILFPLAFHMQRAPRHWSSTREMYQLSLVRKKRFPHIIHSSLSNVAISMRLHSMPQRFIWSGLQSYYDVIQLIESIKNGEHPHIDPDFSFHIFAYSIGGFLAQILKLSNFNGYFNQTKVCLFCSGATFNRLSPVSKFILDSEANVALYSFLVEHFDTILQKDQLLNHYIKGDHVEGKVFHSMLDYQKMRDFREGLLKKYESQIYAITLVKDKVIPSFEVINTLNGAYRDINIKVDELDFERAYTHENPFPVIRGSYLQVDADYQFVFNKVISFFNG
jgi:hypothetical protein